MDQENFKKILKIIIFVAIVIGLALAIYYVFFRSAVLQLSGPTQPITNTQLPGSGNQLPNISLGNVNREPGSTATITQNTLLPEGFTAGQENLLKTQALTTDSIVSPTLSGSNVNYYAPSENLFYRLKTDGTAEQLATQRFYNVSNVTWSGDGNKAVLEYPDSSNIVYDFNTKKQYTLPKELTEFAFSSTGQELAAKAISDIPGNDWLVTLNTDGSGVQFVEPLGENGDKVAVNWSPSGQVIALYNKNISASGQEVLLIGRNQENFYSLKTIGRGFEGAWTPKGDKLLYSVYSSDNGFKPTLWLTDAQGDNVGLNNKKIGLNTWSDKCVMAGDNQAAYCAVPIEMPEGSGIYREMASGAQDDFYKVDFKTGQTELLPVDGWHSTTQLLLSADGKTLYLQELGGGVTKVNLN